MITRTPRRRPSSRGDNNLNTPGHMMRCGIHTYAEPLGKQLDEDILAFKAPARASPKHRRKRIQKQPAADHWHPESVRNPNTSSSLSWSSSAPSTRRRGRVLQPVQQAAGSVPAVALQAEVVHISLQTSTPNTRLIPQILTVLGKRLPVPVCRQ